jgi:hypothetical protein
MDELATLEAAGLSRDEAVRRVRQGAPNRPGARDFSDTFTTGRTGKSHGANISRGIVAQGLRPDDVGRIFAREEEPVRFARGGKLIAGASGEASAGASGGGASAGRLGQPFLEDGLWWMEGPGESRIGREKFGPFPNQQAAASFVPPPEVLRPSRKGGRNRGARGRGLVLQGPIKGIDSSGKTVFTAGEAGPEQVSFAPMSRSGPRKRPALGMGLALG